MIKISSQWAYVEEFLKENRADLKDSDEYTHQNVEFQITSAELEKNHSYKNRNGSHPGVAV